MSTALFATAAVATKALENLADDIYKKTKESASTAIKRWRLPKKLADLYKKAAAFRKVKTIWQFERPVDIETFYFPTRVIIENKKHEIKDVDNFPAGRNILVLGTIGQGKSIFFRYLASRELQRGRCIPLFVELRRIEQDESLTTHLIKELSALGIKVDNEMLEFLLAQGYLMLFLDAFDEVRESEQSRVVTQIEMIAREHEKTRIFVSARPGTRLEGSKELNIVRVAKLEGNDYEHVVRRMAEDDATADAIINGTRRQTKVRELLDTPLIVALLVIKFKADQSIPANKAAFYEKLFELMMQRHDSLKAGYVRPRKAKLSDGQLEDAFSAFCYLSRKDNVSAFKTHEVRKYMSKALQTMGLTAEADNVIRDVSEVTCLLLDDGGEFRFIHKSVQEFHAACFVRDNNDEAAKAFYSAMVKLWGSWIQELEFLSVIDRDRYEKYFKVPSLCNSLLVTRLQDAKDWKPTTEVYKSLLGGLIIHFGHVKGAMGFQGSRTHWCMGLHRVGEFAERLFREANNSGLEMPTAEKWTVDEKVYTPRLMNELTSLDSWRNVIERAAEPLMKKLHSELLETMADVERRDSMKTLLTF